MVRLMADRNEVLMAIFGIPSLEAVFLSSPI